MAIEVIIQKLHAGYKLTVYPQRSLVLTAQELRDIYGWCLLHMRELEAEARIQEAIARNQAMKWAPNEIDPEEE